MLQGSFLDAIASPSTYPSDWVSDVFRFWRLLSHLPSLRACFTWPFATFHLYGREQNLKLWLSPLRSITLPGFFFLAKLDMDKCICTRYILGREQTENGKKGDRLCPSTAKWQPQSSRVCQRWLVVYRHLVKNILRHIGLLEADEDKIRKIRPKGTQVIMLYVPREPIRP